MQVSPSDYRESLGPIMATFIAVEVKPQPGYRLSGAESPPTLAADMTYLDGEALLDQVGTDKDFLTCALACYFDETIMVNLAQLLKDVRGESVADKFRKVLPVHDQQVFDSYLTYRGHAQVAEQFVYRTVVLTITMTMGVLGGFDSIGDHWREIIAGFQ
ncbi:hypothetical protein IWQ60_009044 [Tieghemiomyces parasiticus]|uniref:Uncharacterized protein n=1 Tax=Tieghemiomyces parasiticus TaxID=78921 RepID=A0A9W7ZV97_9FUNG|nr:hypothetical protein IWQ60_009044 [Tieghemiomyces parasiticus]